MHWLTLLQTLGAADWKNIRRDALLRWMIIIPLFVAFLVRVFLPPIQTKLIDNKVLALEHVADLHLLVMTGLFVFLNPLLIGFVIGMLFLDERDEGTMLALRVTPLSVEKYLLYKLTMPILLSTIMALLCFPLSGLQVKFRPSYILIVLASSLIAPVAALFMAAFAQNKVQGFALVKALNVVLVPPFAVYFFDAWWEVFFGISPVYWLIEAFWRAEKGDAAMWIFLFVGVLYQGVLMMLFLRRFRRLAT